MRIRLFALVLAAVLGLTACAPAQKEEARLTVVATTYPVYLFACAVTEGVEGVRVERLNTGETSCLHDYTLSVNDMKLLERADVIVMNGGGLEEFLEDALAASDAAVIDCAHGIDLLENESHHHEEGDHSHDGHDHGHFDSHLWMDPDYAGEMVAAIAEGMEPLDPEHGETYRANARSAGEELTRLDGELTDLFADLGEVPGLITFHDGFQYFAHAYGLTLLESIEEEAGSEASAREIVEVTELVREYDLPVIFTEVNGSDATARAISRETGCGVVQLSMCMDGPDSDLSNYTETLRSNARAIVNGFGGKEAAA